MEGNDILLDFMTIRLDYDDDKCKVFKISGNYIIIENLIVREENIKIDKIVLVGSNIIIGRLILCCSRLNVGKYVLNDDGLDIQKKVLSPAKAKIEGESFCVMEGYNDWMTMD